MRYHKLKPTIINIVLTFLHQTLTTHIDVKENPKILNTKLHNEPQVFTLNKCLNSDYHTAGEFGRKNLWRIYHNALFGKRKVLVNLLLAKQFYIGWKHLVNSNFGEIA